MDQLLSVVSVCGLTNDVEDRAFWHAQSPESRLRALEFLRRVMYGDAATAGLQRILAVAQLEPG